jgi:predicted AAA+ superfamily ATPase
MQEDDFSRLLSLMPKVNLLNNPVEYFDTLKRNYVQLSFYENSFASFVNEYLLVGGYLEYFSSKDIHDWQSKLVDIVYYVLYKDILVSYDVSSGKILDNLFRFVGDNSGKPYSYNSIGKELGISPITISSYLSLLEKAHLIVIQELISLDSRILIKSNKRIHIGDNGIRNAIGGVDILSEEGIGFCAETAVTSYANNICKDNHWILNYKDKNEEAVIVNKKNSTLLIDVKYKNTLNTEDFQIDKGWNHEAISIVVTKSTLKREDNTLFIPFWLIK